MPPGDFEIARRTAEVARRRGVSAVQVALAWLLHQPGVAAPIVGATKLEQLDDLARAPALALDSEEKNFLTEPYTPHAVLGH